MPEVAGSGRVAHVTARVYYYESWHPERAAGILPGVSTVGRGMSTGMPMMTTRISSPGALMFGITPPDQSRRFHIRLMCRSRIRARGYRRDQGTVTWPWPTRYFGVQYCAMAL